SLMAPEVADVLPGCRTCRCRMSIEASIEAQTPDRNTRVMSPTQPHRLSQTGEVSPLSFANRRLVVVVRSFSREAISKQHSRRCERQGGARTRVEWEHAL